MRLRISPRRAGTASALFFLVLALGLWLSCGGSAQRPRHVVLVTLDTTRADHLSCYGHPLETSPNVDNLARAGLLFERAFSTSSWTLPAHASLFTGKFPRSHGARYDEEGPLVLTSAIQGPADWDRYRARGMAADEITLAALLSEHGWQTAGFVAGPWLKRPFGLDAGFEHWDDSGIEETNGRPAADVTEAARRWLAERGASDRPFFVFLNYYDPHLPLDPPPGFRERFLPPGKKVEELPREQALSALYDAEIRYMDHHLGLLFQELKQRGLWDDCWVIVTSDHGELLGENGRIGHGRYLTTAELHIPLIVKAPAGDPLAAEPRRVREAVQLTDVLPFLVERLALRGPPGVQGESLLSVRHPIVAETHPLPSMSADGDWEAIIAGDRKLAKSSLGVVELFDFARDPAESQPLVEVEAARAQELSSELERFLGALPPPGPPAAARALDEETLRTLEGLGYVGPQPR